MRSPPRQAVPGERPELLGFDELPGGTVVTGLQVAEGGAIAVRGRNPALGAAEAALVFDSSRPSGGDLDLGTPHVDFGGPGLGAGGARSGPYPNALPRGRMLIVAEDLLDADGDGLVDDPDDTAVMGATLEFDFTALGTVAVQRLLIVDVELDRPPATVELVGRGGNTLELVVLPQVGDDGVAVAELGGLPGVRRMLVTLNGSAAIDEIVYRRDAAAIGGRVFCDLDRDGVPDPGEPGIGDVLIVLLAGPFGDVRFTAPDGSFLFEQVPPGPCLLNLDEATLPAGKIPGRCPTSQSLSPLAGQSILDADFCAALDGSVPPR